jgi:putative endonuclease
MRRRSVGRLGEDLATDLLGREGYKLVERNWRDRTGEIDIVARDGECWVFVEVKARHGHWLTLPEDGLTDEKASRLRQLALNYLAAHDLKDATWRIDLVAIELDDQNRVVRADLLPSVALL